MYLSFVSLQVINTHWQSLSFIWANNSALVLKLHYIRVVAIPPVQQWLKEGLSEGYQGLKDKIAAGFIAFFTFGDGVYNFMKY